jgi:hypothetical protein
MIAGLSALNLMTLIKHTVNKVSILHGFTFKFRRDGTLLTADEA